MTIGTSLDLDHRSHDFAMSAGRSVPSGADAAVLCCPSPFRLLPGGRGAYPRRGSELPLPLRERGCVPWAWAAETRSALSSRSRRLVWLDAVLLVLLVIVTSSPRGWRRGAGRENHGFPHYISSFPGAGDSLCLAVISGHGCGRRIACLVLCVMLRRAARPAG